MSPTALDPEQKEYANSFRQHVPDLNIPRFQIAKDQNAYEYADAFQKTHHPPWLYDLTQAWEELLQEPYKGVSLTNGKIVPDLFPVQDEGVPIVEIVAAANNVTSQLSEDQKIKVSYPINAKEWRAWSNPEFLLRPFGLRLEDVDENIATSILAVLKATFSPEGYDKAIAAMRINEFLGGVCKVQKIMNKYSYNFLIFGTPSTTEAWGFNFYGHHLCLNVFFKGPQIFVSPTFTGAEPNVIDEGEWKGTAILHIEGDLGFKLMQSLSPDLQEQATIFKLMKDPAMKVTGDLKSDRWNPDDQRHICGAFRDNRVVPEEGIPVAQFDDNQQQLVLDIVEQFVLYLPEKSRRLRLDQVKAHIDTTFFSWIGGHGENDAFYYRIQSPVIIVEFDHHSGVFLNNKEPAKFHTHTILRTPNCGDYGCALRKLEEMPA